jgi:REP element-mobilizing transposase RayT
MPAPPRVLFPGTVVLITTRVEEGLPFVCTEFMELILWSCIARAQELHHALVCHLVVMPNHFHIILVVQNPDDVVGFMDRVKTESAHAVNHLLGRRKRKVWCESYHSLPLLTVKKVIEKIVYTYVNPQAANLIDSIEEYPGVSSWKMWTQRSLTRKVPWVRRTHLPALKRSRLSRNDQRAYAQRLREKARESNTFTLTPDAWMPIFGIDTQAEMDEVNDEILEGVRAREAELRQERAAAKRSCLGCDALIDRPIDVPYTPKKFGRRLWCLSDDISRKVQFINLVKELREEARVVREKWKLGDYSQPYPIGLFPPNFIRTANLVPPVLD